jgi:ribosomal protein S18 acetylase RimI-like enzyme
MDSCRTAGCTVAELCVMDGNERAQHFYRSHGWLPVAGHKRENVRGIEVDEVCFQAAL